MKKMIEAHYLSMIIIGVGSLSFGILPAASCFRLRSYPFYISLVLCLGAGVLLATSLVHMLSDVQERLKLHAQLYFCVGLLCLYTFDEISHYCLGIKKPHVHSENHKRSSYGATQHSVGFSEISPFLESGQNKLPRRVNEILCDNHCECSHSHSKCTTESQESPIGSCSHSRNNDQDEVVYPVVEGEDWSSNPAAKTGLFISLLIHSILEGISIGVQTKISQILLILGAVTFHKIVLSFCLGLELHHNGCTKSYFLLAIFLFSIGSPLGILLGSSVTALESGVFSIDNELQAVAAGSLLYVALLEVLPRERSKWRLAKNAAGILQLIFLILGFAFITSLQFLLDS